MSNQKTLVEQVREHLQEFKRNYNCDEGYNLGYVIGLNKFLSILDHPPVQTEVEEGMTYEALRPLAIAVYGDDPNLYGGQRDGYIKGLQDASRVLPTPPPTPPPATDRQMAEEEIQVFADEIDPDVDDYSRGRWYGRIEGFKEGKVRTNQVKDKAVREVIERALILAHAKAFKHYKNLGIQTKGLQESILSITPEQVIESLKP